MGRRAVTQNLYDDLVRAFRDRPGNYTQAAKAAGCQDKTAARAWNKGWPQKMLKPIKQQIEFEQMEARKVAAAEAAARRAKREKELQDARAAAVQSRAQEGQMVTMARQAALAGVSVTASLLMGCRPLAAAVKAQLEAEAKQPPVDALSMATRITLLKRVADTMETINRAAHEAMEMERLHLGSPTDAIRAIDDMAEQDTTLGDAKMRVEAAQQALESVYRQHGHLRVIEGGMLGVDDQVMAEGEKDPQQAKDDFDEPAPAPDNGIPSPQANGTPTNGTPQTGTS